MNGWKYVEAETLGAAPNPHVSFCHRRSHPKANTWPHDPPSRGEILPQEEPPPPKRSRPARVEPSPAARTGSHPCTAPVSPRTGIPRKLVHPCCWPSPLSSPCGSLLEPWCSSRLAHRPMSLTWCFPRIRNRTSRLLPAGTPTPPPSRSQPERLTRTPDASPDASIVPDSSRSRQPLKHPGPPALTGRSRMFPVRRPASCCFPTGSPPAGHPDRHGTPTAIMSAGHGDQGRSAWCRQLSRRPGCARTGGAPGQAMTPHPAWH